MKDMCIGIVMLLGLLVAMSEGEWFPWANLCGTIAAMWAMVILSNEGR